MILPQIDLWYGFAPGADEEPPRSVWRLHRSSDSGESRSRAELTPEDSHLVSALRGDDLEVARSAFDTVYREYAVAIARFAYGYLRSRTGAEDVVADVFLAVWARREEWEPRYGVRAYLYASARHRALNVLRGDTRAARRMEVVAAEASHAVLEETPEDESGLEVRLAAVLAALPEESRRLAELRWREGMTPGEIAAVLGIDRSAVDNRLSRLVKRLRALAIGKDFESR